MNIYQLHHVLGGQILVNFDKVRYIKKLGASTTISFGSSKDDDCVHVKETPLEIIRILQK